MKHFINLKDIPAKDLRKILIDAKKRKKARKKLNNLDHDKGMPLKGKLLIQMFEKSKCIPDIVPIAKGIGGGFPIGAVLMNKKVAAGMTPGTHGSTFGGNPLAMAVGNAVMDIVSSKKFLNNIKRLSKYFFSNLNLLKKNYPKVIKDIRGKGYLIGIQLHKDQTKFIQKLMDKKLLTIRAAENVIRILPPLNVKKNELDAALKIINKVCAELK